MKKTLSLLVLLMAAAAAFAAAPTFNEVGPVTGSNYLYDTASKTWRTMVGNSDGGISVSVTPSAATPTYVTPVSVQNASSAPIPAYDARGRVTAPTTYYTNLSTSTPALLSSIASWTPPCFLQIQTNAVCFYTTATTTAATVFAGQRMAAYDTVAISPSATTFDISFIASSSANASLTVSVWPLVP